jgi:hypothetical protein
VETSNISNIEAETSNRSNIGGRKKGSTVRGKAADEKKRDDVLAQCALLYHCDNPSSTGWPNLVGDLFGS